MICLNARWIGYFVAATTMFGCSGVVTVGSNTPSSDASTVGDAAPIDPCVGQPVPTIACNPGPTEWTCNTSVSPPRWDIVCPGPGPGPVADAGGPCDGLGFIAIGCGSGEPTYTCNTSGPSPRWDVTCPGPGKMEAGVLPPNGCCPSGFTLSGDACVVTCSPGQACPALAVQPHCTDAGPSDGGASASDATSPPDTGVCCPAGWLDYSCQYPEGGAGFACHNPALSCPSSSTCGLGCDLVVRGPCGQ